MAEEIIKEELQNEEPTPEKIESGETVVTEPTEKKENNEIDLTQLEQRVTSLEQRLLEYEKQLTQNESNSQNLVEKSEQTPNDDIESTEDNIESTDEIKDILNL